MCLPNNFSKFQFNFLINFIFIVLFAIGTLGQSSTQSGIAYCIGSDASETETLNFKSIDFCTEFLGINELSKNVITEFTEQGFKYRKVRTHSFVTCMKGMVCYSFNEGKYLEPIELNYDMCVFLLAKEIPDDLKTICTTITTADQQDEQLNADEADQEDKTGNDQKPKQPQPNDTEIGDQTEKNPNLPLRYSIRLNARLPIPQIEQYLNLKYSDEEFEENNQAEKGAFTISFLSMLACLIVIVLIIIWTIWKLKKQSNQPMQLDQEENEFTPKTDLKSILNYLKMKFSILLIILFCAFMVNLLLTILTGIAAFGMSSCECSEGKMFCNRMVSVTGGDPKLLVGAKEGYCVSIKQLKLESGFSCKGGNDEYDNLKSKCNGKFSKVEQDICSHWCPLGQKKGLCQTMQFNIKPCSLIESVGYDVELIEDIGTLTTSVDVKPFCENYVRMDRDLYCASLKINTITSIDELSFFDHQPNEDQLQQICLSKGFINPNSISCHYLWEVGETKLEPIQPQIKFNFIATFNDVKDDWCEGEVTDFYCENTPVVGDGEFHVMSNCYNKEEKSIITVEEPLKHHCSCMWCKNGFHTYSCNQVDRSRNSTYFNSNSDAHDGANSNRSSKHNWLWISLAVIASIVIIIIIIAVIAK